MLRLRRTWQLVGASWEVLRQDAELLVLPVLSGLASLVAIATFAVPVVSSWGAQEPTALSYLLLAVAYFGLASITVFFNAALVSAADERLRGGDPTLASALRGASRRLPQVLAWGAVSATVSVILQAVEERLGVVGSIVTSLLGMAWAVVTFLVLPVFVLEGVGVGAAVRRSAELLRRTWGENVTAQVGFAVVGVVPVVLAVVLGAAGVAAGGAAAVAGITVAVVVLALSAVVLSALSMVFQTALYHYATAGDAPAAFGSGQLRAAFGPRRS